MHCQRHERKGNDGRNRITFRKNRKSRGSGLIRGVVLVNVSNVQGAFEIIAETDDHGKRLDFFVAEHIERAQRSRINDLARDSLVFVNGRSKKPSYKIKAGDTVSGTLPPLEPLTFEPEKIDLDILYEDKHLIVLNKQAGLVVHPAPGNWSGTLVNGLMYHCPEIQCGEDEIRPGIVHRLDRDTSGVMIVAKNREALFRLSRMFQDRDVKKQYKVIVYGCVENTQGIIDLPIGRHPVHRTMMSTRSPRGKHAETHFKVEKRYSHASCLTCDIKTGRTHQIRVHCLSMGHPVVGDSVYASARFSKKKNFGHPSQGILTLANRQMLHSYCLTITHPVTQERLTFSAPIPEDMAGLISGLENCENT